MILHLRIPTALGARTVIAHCGEQDADAIVMAVSALDGGAGAKRQEQGGKSLSQTLHAYWRKKAKQQRSKPLLKNVTQFRSIANAK